MTPLLIFAVAMVIRLGKEERATFQRGATERTRALLTALDAELGSSITVLEALATWDYFDSDDLQSFYEDATRVLRSQPSWVTLNLALPTGQQLINLQRPFGTQLPNIVERQSFDQVLQRQKPTVGQLSQGPLVNQPAFTVRVPVIRKGVVRYVLTAIVDPRSISALLSLQGLPTTWIGAVVDGNRRFIARTVNPERSVGQLASESLRAALDRAPEGWFHGATVEGLDVYTPYSRSEFSGWSVAIGIPAAAVEANFRRSLLYVGFFGLALVALGIAIAWILSSRTAKSIGSLGVMAENLGLGNRPAAGTPRAASYIPSGVAEIEAVREALLSANRLIREHSEQRDRVEAQLRGVSERLELAQEAASIGSFERNLITDEVKWSASQEKLYGLKAGSFRGTHQEWASRVHPEDIAHAEMAVQQAIVTQSALQDEYRIILPNGELRWIASLGRVFADETGKPLRIIGVNIDITGRKRTEEALLASEALMRTATDHARVGLVVLDNERRYSFANPAYADLLGLSRETNPIIGKSVAEVLGELYETVRPQLDRAFSGERVSFEMVGPPIKEPRANDSRYFAATYEPQRDANGQVIGVVAVIVDIAERKRAEEALRESDRRKDEFLAMLGHELRNPLGVINTSVQLLRRKGPPEPALLELQQMIARQVEHMSRMLDDLLDVSRIARGQIRLKKELCDFTEIVRHAVDDHRGNFDENGLQLIARLPDSALWVMGDRTRLAQVVGNLLYNANKFTDPGGTVTLSLIEAPGPSALLCVADTGIGIEPAILRQIFEPFIQSDHSIDRSRGGLGLGLALVKGLVELHGGEARAESEGLGRGSEFTIRLPLEQPALLPRAPCNPLDRKQTPRCRILIIEDNPMAARSLQMYLHSAGHNVEVAHTGPDGIEAARRFRPELVLCDIGLPGFDGYEVARSLRQEKELNRIYLVAISGYGRDGDQLRARDAGFNLHLSKPVDLDKIDAILADLPRLSEMK
jgi:PAS domain S-box-containing protein